MSHRCVGRFDMGFYSDSVFPRVMNVMMNTKETRRIREEVCAPLNGTVIEIGFGTGLNLPHLPASVTCLKAVEPRTKGRELARRRVQSSHVSVEFVGLDGERLPLEDQCVDDALSTWTLCSIDDPIAAIRELVRVLRPGGKLHFVEHGQSPDPKVRRWQDRMEGVQQRLACGCSLKSDIPAIIRDGGMTIDNLETHYAKGEPKHQGWTFQGIASPS